jgi:YebC/PmpR family DNA-binding regulatory protein
MAGHSAWSNIKHRKARQDKLRGKAWSKVSRAIMSAVRQGGGDPKFNVTLRYAVDEAKAANMPRDTIERLIKKASGEGADAATFHHVRYEGYAPGGVAVIADCLTDNVTRTAPEIRTAFEKHGGNLGKPGSVSHTFAQQGVFLIEAGRTTEDRLMQLALDAGAEDVVELDGDGSSSDSSGGAGGWQVTCEPTRFHAVKEALDAAGIECASAEITMIPSLTVPCDADAAAKVLRIVNVLEENDDVQKVYHNAEIPDEALAG